MYIYVSAICPLCLFGYLVIKDSCHSLLTDSWLHKMQSCSSVPVLILVLCCMASAHNNFYKRALEINQDCNFPPNTPQWCEDSLSDFLDNSTPQWCKDASSDFLDNWDNVTALPSILEKFCDPTCAKLMDVVFECYLGPKNIADFMCVTYENKYCYVIGLDFEHSCLLPNHCSSTCSESCRKCHVEMGNDFSCCLVKYRHFDFFDASFYFSDACGDRYNSCDAIAL